MSADDILAEDGRRRVALSTEFDPVSGAGSTGERTLLRLPDFIIREQHIPSSMLSEPVVADLLREGSVAAAARSRGESPAAVADRLMRLRLLHDFPFWAAMTASYSIARSDGLWRVSRACVWSADRYA